MDTNMKDLPRFEREIYMSLSDDAEAKAAGEAKQYKVRMVIEAGWSVDDLVDRLLQVTTSPRVAFQNGNRGKNTIPTEYVVPKMGMRASAPALTPYQMLEALLGKEKCLAMVNNMGGNVDKFVARFKALLETMDLEAE